MIIWSGWGIIVLLIAVIGVVVSSMAGTTFEDTAHLAYGPSHALGIAIGGVLAAAGVFLFARWRESGEGRVFIDEASGQRIEVRNSAGSLFFIPTRYWTWIILAITLYAAFTVVSATGPSPSSY